MHAINGAEWQTYDTWIEMGFGVKLDALKLIFDWAVVELRKGTVFRILFWGEQWIELEYLGHLDMYR